MGLRYFKIFPYLITWDKGNNRCREHDPESKLAVVSNNIEVKELGRFMKIGRPSLEIAYVGGRCSNNVCYFEAEKFTTDFDELNLGSTTRNEFSCLVVDQHKRSADLKLGMVQFLNSALINKH